MAGILEMNPGLVPLPDRRKAEQSVKLHRCSRNLLHLSAQFGGGLHKISLVV